MLVSRGNIRIKGYLKVTFMERENCCVFREEGDGDIFTWKNYDINSIILLSNSYQGTFPFCPRYLRLLTMFLFGFRLK